jgi:hypothetical protein
LGAWDWLEPRTLLSNTWYVDSSFDGVSDGSRGDPFTTIQAAINAASPDDTILVETGKGYKESDTIGVSNLTIKADLGASPILDVPNASFFFSGSTGFSVSA